MNSIRHGTLSGLLADTKLLYDFGHDLTNSEAWPNRYKGNEFRAVRAATLTRPLNRLSP